MSDSYDSNPNAKPNPNSNPNPNPNYSSNYNYGARRCRGAWQWVQAPDTVPA